MEDLDKSLLLKIADLHEVPSGAYNIRKNGKLLGRRCSDGIDILSKEDKPGIDIKIADNVKNKSVHIPVIVTEDEIKDLVYNDFYVGRNAEVLIVAGCGLHNDGNGGNAHNGIHEFFIEENAVVRYVEKHYAEGNQNVTKDLNPRTIIHLKKGAKFFMETAQLGGVTSTIRETFTDVDDGAVLDIKESILTEFNQNAKTIFKVNLNGKNSKVNVVSRSVAKGKSQQEFISNVFGNNECFGHVSCDAIVMDKAMVSSTPSLKNTHPDAELSHEAVIGKIAGDQLIKLQTLGLTKDEAEKAIVDGFLK